MLYSCIVKMYVEMSSKFHLNQLNELIDILFAFYLGNLSILDTIQKIFHCHYLFRRIRQK